MTLSFLKKPYPYLPDLRKSLLSHFLIGVFVALFLIVFQPFGISLWVTENKLLKLMGFGLVSFLAPALVQLLSRLPLSSSRIGDHWTIGREIVSITCVLVLIAFGNMVFANLLGIMQIGFATYISLLCCTCLLGIFPVTASVIMKHNRLMRIHLQQAVEMNRKIETLHSSPPEVVSETNEKPESKKTDTHLELLAENEKDSIRLELIQLLYIEAADNYCSVLFTENNRIKKQLLRSSLKRMEQQIAHQAVVRCHRTFIANLENVARVEGNAAGYRLFFNGVDESVPVSRSYAPEVLQHLESLK